MISQETIQEAIRRLVTAYDPLKIYLFGSYAWGKPDDESDLDLLLVVDTAEAKRYKRGFKASDALWGLKIPKEILIFTKDEFEQFLQDQNSLCYQVDNKGKILYARS